MEQAVMPSEELGASAGTDGPSLITLLGVVSGEVLLYTERQGRTTLRHLIQTLEWPASFIMMGVGALVRQGLLRALQQEVDIILEPA